MAIALPTHSNGVTLNLDELLQYKSQSVRWLPPAKSLWSQLNGQHESAKKGRGMDFSEVRQYQAGDDIRSIDWRVTARTGKAHTKLFSEEREQPVILYLDLSSSMLFGSTLMLKSVQMAHLASVISWMTTAQKDRIGAVIDTGHQLIELKPSAMNQAPLNLMQRLIELNNTALDEITQNGLETSSFTPGLHTLNRLCPKGSEIIFMSDFVRFDQSDYSLFNQICRHNRVRLVQFFDPLELGQTQFKGSKPVTDGKKTQWFNFSSKSDKNKLAEAFLSKQEDLKAMCLSLAIPFTSISSARPLLEQITENKNDR